MYALSPSALGLWASYKANYSCLRYNYYIYRIYPNKSRADINAWAQTNAGFSTLKEINAHVKGKRSSYKMPGQ